MHPREADKKKSALAGRRPGAEDLHAALMVGGMISSTVLALTLIPAICTLVNQWRLKRGIEL